MKKLILSMFLLSIILIPIHMNYIKFTLLGSFLLIFTWVFISTKQKIAIPLLNIIILYIIIFLVGFNIALYNENNLTYIIQDSFGFLIYLTYPVIFLFINKNNLYNFLLKFLIIFGIFFAFFHIIVFLLFYTIQNALTYDSLMAANLFIKLQGFSWELGASGGILRVNTKAGHCFLIIITILLIDYLTNKDKLKLLFIFIIFIAIILDGHRILIISSLVLFLSAFLITLSNVKLYIKTYIFFCIGFVLVSLFLFNFVLDINLLLNKFNFDGVSTNLRILQIDSLLYEINNSPIFGNGFGHHAILIRNDERPFMYEVDFLAIMMKIGIIGFLLYISLFIYVTVYPLMHIKSIKNIMFFALGISYLMVMGANGGFAMSPISSFFHLTVFLLIYPQFIKRNLIVN